MAERLTTVEELGELPNYTLLSTTEDTNVGYLAAVLHKDGQTYCVREYFGEMSDVSTAELFLKTERGAYVLPTPLTAASISQMEAAYTEYQEHKRNQK